MKVDGGSLYDIVLPHERLTALPDNKVFGLLKTLFPEYGLYRMSSDWRNDKQYILKAKGTRGDVIVGWLGNQNNGQESIKHCPIL